jgi:hypothetical protein
MSIFRYYTTDSLGKFSFQSMPPYVRDPEEGDISFESGSSPKDYFFSIYNPNKRSSSVASDPSSGRPRKVRKQVRFVDDLRGTQRGIPPLKDRTVPFVKRGWSAKEALSFWQERYRLFPDQDNWDRITWWFTLGFDWGWDSMWYLDEFHSSSCWGCRKCAK